MMQNLKRQIERILKNPKIEVYILFFVFLVGFLVRLYKVDSEVADWHSFRQADTASVAREYIENGINLLYPKYHDISRIQSGIFNPEGYRFVEFPIYNALIALFYKLVPFLSLEIWARLISIFSALLSAFILYLLGKKYISKFGGLLGAFFYLFLPYNIFFTRVILPEPIAIAFGLGAILAFDKFLESAKYKFLYTSAFLFAISILIKPYTIFYGLPILIFAHQKFDIRKIIKQKEFVIAALIAFLPLLLWRFWIAQYPEGIPFWKWTLNGDGVRFKPAFWYWIFGERLVKLILGFWGIIPVFVGLVSFKKKNSFIHYFLFGSILFTFVVATANVRHDYYQTIIVPSISLALALGVHELWLSREFNKNLIQVFTIFSLFIMFFAGAFQIKEFYKINHPEIIEAGKAIDELTPKESIIIASYWGDTAFLYQTKRRGYPHVELPIDELIREGAEYYASVDLGNPQTQEFMSKFVTVKKTDRYVILDLKKRI